MIVTFDPFGARVSDPSDFEEKLVTIPFGALSAVAAGRLSV